MIGKNYYQAYLIRCQRSDGQPHWRVTLQNAQTNEVMQFASERQLISFLLDTLKCDPQEPQNNVGDSPHVPQ